MEYVLENKSILLLSGLLALIFVFIKDKWVTSQPVGNERMATIAKNISDGAMSFLKAEYTMLSFFVIVVGGLLTYLGYMGEASGKSHSLLGFSFLMGAICSGLAGFIGMKVATKANVRTTNAAQNSLGEALSIAFSGGAVMGLGVVGLGMLGLANLLKKYKVTYKQFGVALAKRLNGETVETVADAIVQQLEKGIELAAEIAREHNMVRAFAIAPTASCSYRSKDLDGFTSTPEIAPPIGRSVDRDSGTFGVEHYDYGDVEIASEVGWDAYRSVADGIVRLLDNTGLLHGYSFNSWSDVVTYDRNFVEEWLLSPQTSLYYSLQVMGNVQDKTDAYAALDDGDVSDYLQDILNKEEVNCDCQE